MSDRENLSEETRRLVDDLGRRMSEERRDFYANAERVTASDAEMDKLEILRSHIDELDAAMYGLGEEISSPEDRMDRLRSEVHELERQMDSLQRRIGGLREEIRELERLGQLQEELMSRSRALTRDSDQDYLEPIVSALSRVEAAAFWLYGDDARERRSAINRIVSFAAAGPRPRWTVVEVDFMNGRRRPRNRAGAEIASEIRDAWDSWREHGGRWSLGGMKPFMKPSRMGRLGVAVILAEFPARERRSVPFLRWLRRELYVGGPTMLVVSSETAPPDTLGRDVRVIECLSRAARIGRRVAKLRIDQGLNRQQLAELAGLNRTVLAELEAGVLDSGGETELRKIAEALNVTVDRLTE